MNPIHGFKVLDSGPSSYGEPLAFGFRVVYKCWLPPNARTATISPGSQMALGQEGRPQNGSRQGSQST
jgi:hypothetical protein